MNLLNFLKALPTTNFKDYGIAISYGQIFNALQILGYDNKDALDCNLKKLADERKIDLICQGNDTDLIDAVRIK